MVKRITLSQFKSQIRQLESQQRQAINRYNQQVRQHNQKVSQNIRDLKSSINRYNNEVRAYNSRIRANQQRLRTEIARLQTSPSTQHTQFRESVVRVSSSFERLDRSATSSAFTPQENFFTDLSEREAANTVSVFNTLANEHPESGVKSEDNDLQETKITDEIAVISEDLDSRWRGALFALHPRNPEAARHFCTSVREIFSEVLELKAPDSAVLSATPNCSRTPRGSATRRSKITYLLALKDIHNPELTDFASEDIDNVIELFDVLNGATHGIPGKLGLDTLSQIKKRVEDGILFLCRIAA